MNFNFIPFTLNADLSHFQAQIQYISSENGVDLYKARQGLKKPILGILVSEVNLYFFEGSLITVYIHLKEKQFNISQIKYILEKVFNTKAMILSNDSGIVYYWKDESFYLGLLPMKDRNYLVLYYTLNNYCVF